MILYVIQQRTFCHFKNLFNLVCCIDNIKEYYIEYINVIISEKGETNKQLKIKRKYVCKSKHHQVCGVYERKTKSKVLTSVTLAKSVISGRANRSIS